MSNNCTYLRIYSDAGRNACAVLCSNNKITGWGINTPPYSDYYSFNNNIKSLGCGSISMAVLNNGKITRLYAGQDIGGLGKLTGVNDIAVGYNYGLALLDKNGGTVTGWGQNNYGQANGGNGLTGVKKILTDGNSTSIAIFNNGTVTGWGTDDFSKISSITGLTGLVDVSMSQGHAIGLFYDGTITGWGADGQGQVSLGQGLTGVTGISAGNENSIALFKDGTITGWGQDQFGQSSAGNFLTGVQSVVSCDTFSVAILSNNTITGWGLDGPSYGWPPLVVPANSLTGQCPPFVNFINLNGLNSGVKYFYQQQNVLNTLPYSGNLNINVSKWKSGHNYSDTLSNAPSLLGNYLFYGEIIDNTNYEYYGKGTGLLTINSGTLLWSGSSGIFTGGYMSCVYNQNNHYFGAYDNSPDYSYYLDLEPYRLIDANNPAAGPVCFASFINTDTNTVIGSYPSNPPKDAGNYAQVYNCNILNNYISGNNMSTGYISIKQQQSKIVVKSFSSAYTSQPNPIQVFTYPDTVPLFITYNGTTQIPVNTGNYDVFIGPINNNYAIAPVTGIYSITGKIQLQTYALGWGNDISRNVDLPTYSSPTGLLGVQKIVGGDDFSVALMSDNSILTWGTGNAYGQQNIPYVNNYVKDIFASKNTTFILDWSGNLTGCGYLFNTAGNGYSGYIPNLTGISGVSAADYYAIALPEDLNRAITGWGDDSLVKFTFRQGFNFTGVSSIATTNLGYICLYYGYAVLFGRALNSGQYNSGQYGQFGWDANANNGTIKKIAASDYCTLFLSTNSTITGFGKLSDSNGNLHDLNIQNTSLQRNILDIAIASGHVLLKTSKYIPPLPQPPPPSTGIYYVESGIYYV